jgi:hypothetical protein
VSKVKLGGYFEPHFSSCEMVGVKKYIRKIGCYTENNQMKPLKKVFIADGIKAI